MQFDQMKRREFITLLGGPNSQKAARELSRAAFGMNCRRVPVPFIACANNKLACVGVPRSLHSGRQLLANAATPRSRRRKGRVGLLLPLFASRGYATTDDSRLLFGFDASKWRLTANSIS
jgi:hypothetical protein